MTRKRVQDAGREKACHLPRRDRVPGGSVCTGAGSPVLSGDTSLTRQGEANTLPPNPELREFVARKSVWGKIVRRIL